MTLVVRVRLRLSWLTIGWVSLVSLLGEMVDLRPQ